MYVRLCLKVSCVFFRLFICEESTHTVGTEWPNDSNSKEKENILGTSQRIEVETTLESYSKSAINQDGNGAILFVWSVQRCRRESISLMVGVVLSW